MKVAFTTAGQDLDAALDRRFGRAAKFLIYDLEAESFEVLENAQNLNAPQGAGIQAAQVIVASGAEALVTGHCGPKAFRVLQTAGVGIFNSGASTVREALAAYQAGEMEPAEDADVEGHWV